MNGHGMSVVGPVESDDGFRFYLKVSSYTEACDAPVAVWAMHPNAVAAADWAKKILSANVLFEPSNFVDTWDTAFTVTIDSAVNAAMFKLMWVG